MRIIVCFVLLLITLAMGTGCDWTSGGGVDSWNSRWNWVNFSGVYRGIDGGVLVTDFTATPGTPGSTNSVSNERVGTTDGSSSVYNGVLSKTPIVPGSVSISLSGYQLNDNGNNSLSGSGKSGAIDYGTGAWSIDLSPARPDAGSAIVASYQYTIAGTEGTGAAGPGSTRITIRSFTVHQEGETLSITDNNGAVYEGKMGGVRGTGGASGSAGEMTMPIGETIIAQFSAKGTSTSGFTVELVGSFQGVVGGAEGGRFFLTGRQMNGTWIEAGGRTGDINGQAAPLPIQAP